MIKIYKYGEVANSEIFARENISSNVEGVVSEIIANVINRGDSALYEYSEKFDKVRLDSLEVSVLLCPGLFRLPEQSLESVSK